MSWRGAVTIRHPSKGTTPALGENARWDVQTAASPHRHKPSKITALVQIGAGIGLVHDAAPWASPSTQDLLPKGYRRTTRGVKHKLGVAGRSMAPRPGEQTLGHVPERGIRAAPRFVPRGGGLAGGSQHQLAWVRLFPGTHRQTNQVAKFRIPRRRCMHCRSIIML